MKISVDPSKAFRRRVRWSDCAREIESDKELRPKVTKWQRTSNRVSPDLMSVTHDSQGLTPVTRDPSARSWSGTRSHLSSDSRRTQRHPGECRGDNFSLCA